MTSVTVADQSSYKYDTEAEAQSHPPSDYCCRDIDDDWNILTPDCDKSFNKPEHSTIKPGVRFVMNPDATYDEANLKALKNFQGPLVMPILLTCTGLNNSHKFDVIRKALGILDDNSSSTPADFIQYHLTAYVSGKDDAVSSTMIDAGKDPTVQDFQKALSIALKFANLFIETNFSAMSGEPKPTKEFENVGNVLHHAMCRYIDPRLLESFTRFGLLNLWDIGLNRTVKPFIECFSGCFTNNSPVFFISFEEAKTLHAIPGAGSHSEGDYNCRSKLQYLLLPYQLALGDSNKITCTVYITHDAEDDKEQVEFTRKTLNELCKYAFQQMMQMGEKVECNVKSIAHNGDCRLLINMFQSVAKKAMADIGTSTLSLFDLFLRCILANHTKCHASCIKHEELRNLFGESIGLKLTDDDVENFCREFTSFGSILDVKQVNPSSDLVIIKPNVFFNELEVFLKQSDVQQPGTYEVPQGRETMIQVLVDVGLAVHMRMTGPDAKRDLLKEVWLSASIKFGNQKNSFAKGAIQFVLSMGAPRLNKSIKVLELIMKTYPSCKLEFKPEFNTVVFQIPAPDPAKKGSSDYVDITMSFMGNVIEVSLVSNENIMSHSDDHRLIIESICSKLISIFKESIQSCWQRFKENCIKYHFAVLCVNDDFGHEVLYSSDRKRHILPAGDLCADCWSDKDFKKHLPVIEIWKRLLATKELEIPQHLKLNGDLSIEDVAQLAKKLAEFSWDAIVILAIELRCPILPIEPDKTNRKEWAILTMLVQWENNENLRNQPDSLRKILARKLLDVEEKCKKFEHASDFEKLARELDMQVLTKKQRKEIGPEFAKLVKRDVDLNHKHQSKFNQNS